MKIYFNITEFPKTIEECYVNNNPVVLNHDIEYIASNFNKVVIENNEADKEDWQTVRDNWDGFIGYLIDTIIQKTMDKANAEIEEIYGDMTLLDIFEDYFSISIQ